MGAARAAVDRRCAACGGRPVQAQVMGWATVGCMVVLACVPSSCQSKLNPLMCRTYLIEHCVFCVLMCTVSCCMDQHGWGRRCKRGIPIKALVELRSSCKHFRSHRSHCITLHYGGAPPAGRGTESRLKPARNMPLNPTLEKARLAHRSQLKQNRAAKPSPHAPKRHPSRAPRRQPRWPQKHQQACRVMLT